MKLQDKGLGNLKQIADMLVEEMRKEIQRNSYSDLTLNMEGAVRGIYDIIDANDIKFDVTGVLEKD